MALPYAKDDSPLSRRIARDYFLTARGDPELDIKVRERKPAGSSSRLQDRNTARYVEKANSARDAETAAASKEAAKPSKATRGVQELTEQINLDSVKDEILRQLKEWRTEN